MQLIGMLDSPYVRRVAVSLQLLGLPFEHRSISVFRAYAEFERINPVVKAPSFVCDDGTVLMDSTLILDHAEGLPGVRRSLMPAEPSARARSLRAIGLALAACEKNVQIVYERSVRPPERRHEPWVARVTGQLLAAYEGLEAEASAWPAAVDERTIDQAAVTAAVTWCFTQQTVAAIVEPARFPALQRLSTQAEQLPAFRRAPHGEATYFAAQGPATRARCRPP